MLKRECGITRVEIGGIGIVIRHTGFPIIESNAYARAKLPAAKFIVPAGRSDITVDLKVGRIPAQPASCDFRSGASWMMQERAGIRTFWFRVESTDGTAWNSHWCRVARNCRRISVIVGLETSSSQKKYWSLEQFIRCAGQVLLVNCLHALGATMIHACGAVTERTGLVFPGVSGAGKTTISSVLAAHPKFTVLNDDRVIIRRTGRQYSLYGTPWHGEGNLANAGSAPIDAIYFLSKGRNNLRKLSPSDSCRRLLTHCLPALWSKESMEAMLEFIRGCVSDLPCYEFTFTPDQHAANYILKAVKRTARR